MRREVQNPIMLVQFFWKDTETNEAVTILEEVTFSDRASVAAFIKKRVSFYSSISDDVQLNVAPAFRVYYLVRANYKI